MSQSDNRYVAHLDILGMTSIVDAGPEKAWEVLSNLVDARDKANGFEIEFSELEGQRISVSNSVYAVTFSDTILLFTKNDSKHDLLVLLIVLSHILHKALALGVPTRSGVSYGKFFFNIEKSMYMGPALIEAYKVGEAAQWIGICFGESFREKWKEVAQFKSGDSDIVVEWLVPRKSAASNCLVVNWPAIFAHDFKVEHPLTTEIFYSAFEHYFGELSQLPSEVKLKYENTTRFINEMLSAHSKS